MNKHILGLCVGLIISGCTLGPDYQGQSLPQFEAEAHKALAFEAYNHQWWLSFNDTVLNELVALSLSSNRDLQAARANIQAAAAVFDDTNNDDLPVLGALAQARSEKRWDGQGRSIHREFQTGMSLNWSLDLFGKLERATQAANAELASARYAHQALRADILSHLIGQYVQVRGSQHRLNVAQENLMALGKTLSLVSLRAEQGLASELDVTRIEVQRLQLKSLLPVIEQEIRLAQYRLLALAGELPNANNPWLKKLAEYHPLPDAAPQLALGKPENALQRRPDIMQAEAELIAATARLGVAKADWYPDISVQGFAGLLSPQTNLLGSQTRAWQVTPGLVWQGLDFASVAARERVAEANLRGQKAKYEQTVIQAIGETNRNLTTWVQQGRRQDTLSLQVNQAQRALDIARVQYKEGLTDLMSLLDTEREKLEAEHAHAEAQTQAYLALVEVYRSFAAGAS